MLMCKHYSEALLKQFQSVCHSSKNQHAELTRAALMQCARESQFIHHTRQFAESSESSWAELVSWCFFTVCTCLCKASLTEKSTAIVS